MTEKLKKNAQELWAKTLGYFAYRADHIVGVDISANAIKVVALDWVKDRPVLIKMGMVNLPPGTMDNGYFRDVNDLTESLRQAVNVSGVKNRDVVLAIGSPCLFIREVNYPAMTGPELAEAVKWDSEKHITWTPGTYYFDYAEVGPTNNDLDVKVLLTAAPHEVVDDMVAAVKAVGLRPVAIDAESVALYRTLVGAENAMVVDIGGEMSKVTIYQGGCPVVTRPIPIGGKRVTETLMDVFGLDFPDAERFKQRQRGLLPRIDQEGELNEIQQRLQDLHVELVRETVRTMQYYNMQNKEMMVNKMILTGGGVRLDNLVQYFDAQVDFPVVVHDPLASLTISPKFDPQYARNLSLQFGVAIGLALGGGIK